MYKVKEYNKAYDAWFGVGRGWIYITNKVDLEEAVYIANKHKNRSGLKTEIIPK